MDDVVSLALYPDDKRFHETWPIGKGVVYHIKPLPGVSTSGSNGYIGVTEGPLAKRPSLQSQTEADAQHARVQS